MQFLHKYLLNGAAVLLGLLGLYRLLDVFAITQVWNSYGLIFGLIQCCVAMFIVFRKPWARWVGMLVGACMIISTATIFILYKRLESTLAVAPNLVSLVGSPSSLDWISGVFGVVLIIVLYYLHSEFSEVSIHGA